MSEERTSAPSLPPDRAPSDPGATPARSAARVIAITGAKGGVGKSVLASNVALYLASLGRKVVLVDADPDGAALHALCGAPPPRPGGPLLSETAVPELSLLTTGFDLADRRARRVRSGAALAEVIADLRADYVVVDHGTGTSRTAVDAFLAAPLPVFVAIPEPTALEATWRFLCRAFLRWVHQTTPDPAARHAIAAAARALGGLPAPLDLWRKLDDDGDARADLVRERMEAFHPPVVLQKTRLRSDLELGEAIRSACKRRLGFTLEYLGHVEYDDAVWSSVRHRRLLLVDSPGSKAAKNVERIARRLLSLESGKRRPVGRTVPPESHHDLIEVERGATEEEVRRAYKRARDVYETGSLACYGLFTPAELDAVRMRLEEAHDVLLDPSRRKPYEMSIFPPREDEELKAPERSSSSEPLPPPPDLTPDTDYTGALLRAVRESQGHRLEDISAHTKVGLGHLSAIEGDDYGALPAPVYVRGFVTEVAKFLKLDSSQVGRTYVRRYRRYLEERQRA